MMGAAKRYYSVDQFQLYTGTPQNKSYDWCYKMATISIVGEKVMFALGITSEHVSIETVYVDAAFDSIGVMEVLGETEILAEAQIERLGEHVDEKVTELLFVDFTFRLLWVHRYNHERRLK